MSEPTRPPAPAADARREEILEQNLARLLQHAKDRPALATEARARMKDALLAKQRRRAQAAPTAPEAGTSAPTANSEASPAPKNVTPLRQRPRRWTYALAGLAAAAVATWAVLPRGAAPPAPLRVENLQPGAERVSLPDGSTALLQAGAVIESTGPRRLRLEKGAALLDIVPGEPFVVTTPEGEVQVLGTRFLLESEGAETRAAVVRGLVELHGAGPSLALRAGEAGVLSAAQPPARQPSPRVSFLARWAREALATTPAETAPARNGLLLARNPRWQQDEWPLPLRRMTLDVQIEDQVARVAVDQTFFNHTALQLEGVYSFPLPSDAALSRLAMYVDGTRMEAGVVERQAARNIYESIVYQRRDPALLEWMQGNLFRVRVFPLPARQEKRLLLSYTQPLPSLYGAERLVVPLPALDTPVGELQYRVRVVGGKDLSLTPISHPLALSYEGDDAILSLTLTEATLGEDLILELRRPAPSAPRLVHAKGPEGEYFSAMVTPELPSEARYEPRRWVLLYDTSASRDAATLRAQATFAGRFLQEIDEDDEVAILAADSYTRAFGSGFVTARALDLAAVEDFFTREGRDGIGDTDLSGALDAALALLSSPSPRAPYILYLGDGIDARGAAPSSLQGKVAGKAAVVSVAVGDAQDAVMLRGLADASGGLFASIPSGDDLAWRAFDLVATLNTPRVLGLEVALLDAAGAPLPGAVVYPSARQLAAGEGLRVVARVSGGVPAALSLKGWRGKEPFAQTLQLPSAREGAAYLPRLWAQARIEALRAAEPSTGQAEITALGMEHFLLTPYTSLLVLETEEMYKQFKVNRGREDDWARYQAPASIPVVTEPAGRSFALAVPSGAPLYRVPRSPFVSPGGSSPSWGGGSQFSVTLELAETRGDLGGMGLGLRGSGIGGGGTGEGTIGLGSAPVTGKGGGGSIAAQPSGASALFGGVDSLTSRIADKEVAKSESLRELGNTRTVVLSDERRAGESFGSGFLGFFMENKAGRKRGARGDEFNLYRYRTLVPLDLLYPTDAGLDDLTEFVPGLLGEPFDLWREEALLAAASASGEVSPEARALLQKARAALSARRLTGPGGLVMEIDAAGHFSASRRLPSGLLEEMAYDGESLVQRYPELGLAVRRPVAPAGALLALRWAPFLAPDPDELAALYDVQRRGEDSLELRRPGQEELVLRLRIDREGRLVEWRRPVEGAEDQVLSLVYTAAGVTLQQEKHALALSFAPAQGLTALSTEGLVEIEAPLREPSYWDKPGEAAPGSEAWRRLQWQRLASYAALSRAPERYQVWRELFTAGPLRRGELVLGSGSLRQLPDKKTLAQATAGLTTDPVGRFVAASWGFSYNSRGASLDAIGEEGGLVRMLSSYRAALQSCQRYPYSPSEARGRLERFFAAYPESELRYVLAYQFSTYLGWQSLDSTVAIWDALAPDPIFGYSARYEAARKRYEQGKYEDAAKRFEAAVQLAWEAGELPDFDYTLRYGLSYTPEGDGRWRRFYAAWRAKALARGDTAALAMVLGATSMSSDPEAEIGRVLGALRASPPATEEDALLLASRLAALGRPEDAAILLAPWVEEEDASAPLLDAAAQLAAQRGDSAEAASLEERALHALDGETLSLAELRGRYERLFGHYAAEAQSLSASSEALAHALDVAREWRRIDPDNAARERRCSSLLYGLQQPQEAWRYLSTLIERAPAEGASYEAVADVLENEAQWEQAESLWRRAVEVEPTNPTWRYRLAQAQLGLGKRSEARASLQQIIDGKDWQPRFANVPAQAKSLLSTLDPR